MSEGQPKPIAENLGNQIVTLIVGKKRKEFTVHKKLLCESCDYFRRVFNRSFREGEEGKIYLEEESEGAVAIFVEWLYRSRIRPALDEMYLHAVFKLYVMAEKICLDELADRAMDAILLGFSDRIVFGRLTIGMASYMWKNTKEESPMRKFIVEALGFEYYQYIGSKNRQGVEAAADNLQELLPIFENNPDFFVAFLTNFRDPMVRRNGQWVFTPYDRNPASQCMESSKGFCRFHYHEKGYKCAAITDCIWNKILPDWDMKVKGDFFHDIPDEKQ